MVRNAADGGGKGDLPSLRVLVPRPEVDEILENGYLDFKSQLSAKLAGFDIDFELFDHELNMEHIQIECECVFPWFTTS